MTLDRCPWFVAGPLLGLLILGLRALVNRPFGVLGGFIDVAESLTTPRRLGLRAAMVAGLVLGGFGFAAASGSFLATAAYPVWPVLQDVPLPTALLAFAGLVMGFGARTAGGCTSGHGLSGMSLGSPASVVSAVTFFGIAVGVAHLVVRVGGAP